MKKYGTTPERYDAQLNAQGGVCAICRREDEVGKRLAVDHDHSDGRIRGLLCGRCNQAIGLLRDDPVIAARTAEYLSESSGNVVDEDGLMVAIDTLTLE